MQYVFLWASGAPNSRAAPGSSHSSYATGHKENRKDNFFNNLAVFWVDHYISVCVWCDKIHYQSHYSLRNSALVVFKVTANYLFSKHRLWALIFKIPASAKLAAKYQPGRWNTGHLATLLTHRRSQEGHGPQIFLAYCGFVLWDAVSQTKYCCSLKVKVFWPPKILGWLRYCTRGDKLFRITRTIVGVWSTSFCSA